MPIHNSQFIRNPWRQLLYIRPIYATTAISQWLRQAVQATIRRNFKKKNDQVRLTLRARTCKHCASSPEKPNVRHWPSTEFEATTVALPIWGINQRHLRIRITVCKLRHIINSCGVDQARHVALVRCHLKRKVEQERKKRGGDRWTHPHFPQPSTRLPVCRLARPICGSTS